MEERGHRETRGGNQPLTSLDLVDPDRLSRFRYGVVTWIDKDGFPFSVATDFLLSENGEILLKRPSVPAIITGGRVGVLFNHITGIPTGGYTDRRYILVWGSVRARQRPALLPMTVSNSFLSLFPCLETTSAKAAARAARLSIRHPHSLASLEVSVPLRRTK